MKEGWPFELSWQDLPVCRNRLFILRVRVPRKELSVHLASAGKQRLSNTAM